MCYSPMIARRLDVVNPDTGKYQYKFLGKLINYLDEDAEHQLRTTGKIDLGFYSDTFVDRCTGEVITGAVVLSCGQCLECRCKHAQEWANRIMLESQYHETSYFVTLTYDDEHVPRTWPYSQDYSHTCRYCDPKTGKVSLLPTRYYRGDEVLTLAPDDLQLFVKRLRRQQSYHHDNIIRYYAVGEYGSQYHRPHYHAIIFGLVLDDIVEVGRNSHGTILHDSETIRRLWGNGITEVDLMTWESAAYCARYTTKKLGKKETDFYAENCLVPEFSRMSLKPAIGYQYYEDHKDEIYKYDEINISTVHGGRKVKPPHYYDIKYDDVYPEQMIEVKGNRREVAERATVARLDRFDGSYFELLEQQRESFQRRSKSLQRKLVAGGMDYETY